MNLIRRDFLQLTGAGITAIATLSPALAQTQPVGPRLTQILRKDLEGQGQVVQESVVNVAEFAPGASSPWHMHPSAQEILYVQEGRLTVEVEGQETSVVAAGEARVITADAPHLVRNENRDAAARALVVYSRSAKDRPIMAPVSKGG